MSRFILFLLVLCAMPLRAAQTMADFSTATPVSTDYVVGYRPPMGSGAERRFTVAQLNTFFSSNITGITNSQISSLAWGKLTSTPTTLSGYGITDAQPIDADLTYLAGFTPTTNVKAILEAADYAAIRTLLSLGNVNNTSDANKPISTATQTALDLKRDAADGISAHGNAGSTETVTWSASTPVHTLTLDSASCTITLNGFTSSKLCALFLKITQDATGGRAITFSPTLAGSYSPTLDTTANGVTWVQLWSIDGGTTIFGTSTADSSGSASVSDTAYGSGWNGATTAAPSKNAVYDWAHTFDTDDDGKVDVLDVGAGIPKTDSSGNVSLATAGTDYSVPAGTETLTNKRITARVTTITSSATPTINTDNCDAVTVTALAAAITSMTTNLSGTPSNFDQLIFRIKDNGTARAITWGASFEAVGAALPTTTTVGKRLLVLFIYDSVTSKWGCVSTATES